MDITQILANRITELLATHLIRIPMHDNDLIDGLSKTSQIVLIRLLVAMQSEIYIPT